MDGTLRPGGKSSGPCAVNDGKVPAKSRVLDDGEELLLAARDPVDAHERWCDVAVGVKGEVADDAAAHVEPQHLAGHRLPRPVRGGDRIEQRSGCLCDMDRVAARILARRLAEGGEEVGSSAIETLLRYRRERDEHALGGVAGAR